MVDVSDEQYDYNERQLEWISNRESLTLEKLKEICSNPLFVSDFEDHDESNCFHFEILGFFMVWSTFFSDFDQFRFDGI